MPIGGTYLGEDCEGCVARDAKISELKAERDAAKGCAALAALERDAAIQAARPEWYTLMMDLIRERNELRSVFVEAKRLRDNGYDGAFIGDATVGLFSAISEVERRIKE